MSRDPATRFVRQLPGDWYKLSEAAELIGVSHSTLRKLISDDREGLVPGHFAMFGKNRIYLYSDDDIERLRKHFESREIIYRHDGPVRRAGRPAIYSKDERKARARLRSRVWYWRNRVKLLKEQGRTDEMLQAEEKLRQIEGELGK